jgi:dTDP-4-amino-4,6-dideoxygalactose transaminase
MKMNEKPAVLGGKPAFKEIVPIVKPPIKNVIEESLRDYKQILESGMITNYSYVEKLEKAIAEFIGVNYCVATANCTSALILAIQALKIKNGEALIPSFTFPVTGHVVFWNNLKIRLVDCDIKTFNISVEDLQEKVTKKSKVIVPVHVFGNPCDVKAINEIAEDYGLKVIYDAAHAFGAMQNGVFVGRFGDAEVFSGSPTKAFTTVEGGILTTNNKEIAEKVRIGRNYGHHGDYNCEIVGLSARMSELHAALGLNLLSFVVSNIKKRNRIAKSYLEGLSRLPGISFQKINSNSKSTYKDFAIIIDEDRFGLNRDELVVCLEKENIMTRRYFYPPLHMQACYPELKAEDKTLPNTSYISKNVVCLPMFSDLTDEQVRRIIGAVSKIQKYAEEIRLELRREKH